MSKRPANVIPPLAQRVGSMLQYRWVRNVILLWPTITGKRTSNKTEDYGVFKASRGQELGQISIYVSDIAKSREWYETLAQLYHSRTEPAEAHPTKPGWTITCCYMSAADHPECLVLIEARDGDGVLQKPSALSFHHLAFELTGNEAQDVFAFTKTARENGFKPCYGPVKHNSEPGGDGESGGNVAVYFYDPDWHNVEFCGAMDTIDNYKERYGERSGIERTG